MLIVVAGLAGLLGVVLSAAAAHAPAGAQLDTAARFLLLHAPVVLAVALIAATDVADQRLARLAGWLIVVGLALFCGDLAMRGLRGAALFPMAAPIGGFVLMAGWGLIALAGLLRLLR